MNGQHRNVVADLAWNDLGGSVRFGDVRQQDEGSQLWPSPVDPRNHEAVVAEIAVVRLVVVDRTAVLPPELHLVELKIGRVAESLGSIHEILVEREPIQLPRPKRSEPQSGELILDEVTVPLGLREVVLPGRGNSRNIPSCAAASSPASRNPSITA